MNTILSLYSDGMQSTYDINLVDNGYVLGYVQRILTICLTFT
jgi:hypothetical protein